METRTVTKWLRFFAAIALTVFTLSAVRAQESPADSMEALRKTIQTEKKLFITQNLQLTEAEAAAFWPLYEDYQEDLEDIFTRTVNLIGDFASSYGSLSDPEADKLLDDFMALQEDRVELQKLYLPKFRAVLPATKVARYYQLENKVRAVMDYEAAAKIPVAH